MNFDWKAFEEGKLAYNARTEEDAKAFLAECEKRGMRYVLGSRPSELTLWNELREDTCYVYLVSMFGRRSLMYDGTKHVRSIGIPIFSEPWQKRESVVEMLRRWVGASTTCGRCHDVMWSGCCSGRFCSDMYNKLADMVEAELEAAKRTAFQPCGQEGQPLKIGNTYFGGDGRPWCVLGFRPGLKYDVIGSCKGEINIHLRSKWLSSVKPDTQERIDDDATMPPSCYLSKYGIPTDGLADSERDTKAMVAHLLERQRKLDARTMGGDR